MIKDHDLIVPIQPTDEIEQEYGITLDEYIANCLGVSAVFDWIKILGKKQVVEILQRTITHNKKLKWSNIILWISLPLTIFTLLYFSSTETFSVFAFIILFVFTLITVYFFIVSQNLRSAREKTSTNVLFQLYDNDRTNTAQNIKQKQNLSTLLKIISDIRNDKIKLYSFTCKEETLGTLTKKQLKEKFSQVFSVLNRPGIVGGSLFRV